MANSNNICTRFINYVAVLILVFLSSQSFAAGGSFGGGGAGGSWDEPTGQCTASLNWQTHIGTQSSVCQQINKNISNSYNGAPVQFVSLTPIPNTTNYSCKNYYSGSDFDHLVSCSQVQCEPGYEKDANGKCQPKKCPVGETLVNGQCQKKQCPAGQALDANGNCMPRDDQCSAGQTMVNGRCTDKPDDPNEPDPNAEWPPFCEWASVMCQWHEEWQQWSNDYAANEQKANLDREELKRLTLDSKENLDEMNQKMTDQLQKLEEQKQKLDELKIPLEQIKQQDQQFYDEVRLWLNNFDSTSGNPSEQNPSIQFPPFCDWSVQVCNWYLDWQDWRNDYNAHNAAVLQKFNDNLTKLEEIKQNDIQHHADSNEFYDDVREFFGWYKNQEQSDPNDPNDPENPANQDGNVPVDQQIIPLDETQRITFVNGCPAGEQFNVSFMGQSQNIEFSYQPLCQFMSLIRPFVIAIAYLIGAYILMGLSRGSSE